jgi:hypothetical protein
MSLTFFMFGSVNKSGSTKKKTGISITLRKRQKCQEYAEGGDVTKRSTWKQKRELSTHTYILPSAQLTFLRSQLLFFKTKALKFVEVNACLHWGDVVSGDSHHGFVSKVFDLIEGKSWFPWSHFEFWLKWSESP